MTAIRRLQVVFDPCAPNSISTLRTFAVWEGETLIANGWTHRGAVHYALSDRPYLWYEKPLTDVASALRSALCLLPCEITVEGEWVSGAGGAA